MDNLVWFEFDNYEFAVEADSPESAVEDLKWRDDERFADLTIEHFLRMEQVAGWDEFEAKYRPIKAVEEEEEDDSPVCFLRDSAPDEDYRKVWTRVEGDDGETTWLTPGFHYVNRLDYIVCEVPWTDEAYAAGEQFYY